MRTRRFLPAAVPVVLGAAFILFDHRIRGVVLVAIGLLVAGLVLAGFDVEGRVAALTHRVVHAVSALLSWGVGVVFFVPTWGISRVLRRDPLRPRGGGGWTERHDGLLVDAGTMYSPGVALHQEAAPRASHRVLVVLGVSVVALAVDLTLGVGWNRLVGDGPSEVEGVIRMVPSATDASTGPDTVRDVPADPRADGVAMRDAPWRVEYFAELGSVGSTYWPFTMSRPRDFRGAHVNITGWERRSHGSSGTTQQSAPTIAFFGGSAMFGEGQRDGHTIASYIARFAEADGVPVHVRNFGQRGWVLWQEMALYEQLLAAGERFDLSVFYDGANDLAVQTQPNSGVPTHFDVESYAQRLFGGPAEGPAAVARSDTEDSLASATLQWWKDRSLVARWAAAITNGLTPAAGASVAVRNDDVHGFEQRAVDVYERARGLTEHLSDTYGVEDSYYWQPQAQQLDEYAWAAAAVGPRTIDLSRSLDGHPETYLDLVHTNEDGARLVAEAMWQTLGQKVKNWYDSAG